MNWCLGALVHTSPPLPAQVRGAIEQTPRKASMLKRKYEWVLCLYLGITHTSSEY